MTTREDWEAMGETMGNKTDSTELKSAVEHAEQKGVLVVSAVGNEGYSDDLYYPAAYETVLAVGSCDENGKESDFSQKNNSADFLAPEENIWMASRNGKTYGAKGTSYATGHISAKAAKLLKEKSNMNPAELRELLKSPA